MSTRLRTVQPVVYDLIKNSRTGLRRMLRPRAFAYFVVEANAADQILNFILPFLNVGKTNVHPVLKWSEARAMTRKLGLQK